MLGTLLVRNEIGMVLHVNVDSVEHAYETMRNFGQLGWVSGEPINRILEFPLAMAERFDWRLIGAREFFKNEVEKESGEVRKVHCVEYRGEVYKRRDLEPRTIGGTRLGAAVKYSRGAHDTDPPEIVEQGQGESKYVSLAIFRGNAPVIDAFCKPKAVAAPATVAAVEPQPAAKPTAVAPAQPVDAAARQSEEQRESTRRALQHVFSALNDTQRDTIRNIAKRRGIQHPRLLLHARNVAGGLDAVLQPDRLPRLLQLLGAEQGAA